MKQNPPSAGFFMLAITPVFSPPRAGFFLREIMDPVAAIQTAMLSALWQVVAPLLVMGVLQVGALIFFLGKMSQVHKSHEEQHADHRKRLDTHATSINKHETEIAVIRATLD